MISGLKPTKKILFGQAFSIKKKVEGQQKGVLYGRIILTF